MIRLANKEANKSTFYYKLGAIIVKGNRVLATGHNSIAHCKLNDFKNSRHAEMDAILHILKNRNGLSLLAGSTIYVSRITKGGETALAKPCSKCMSLIKSVGIKRIIYTKNSEEYSILKV